MEVVTMPPVSYANHLYLSSSSIVFNKLLTYTVLRRVPFVAILIHVQDLSLLQNTRPHSNRRETQRKSHHHRQHQWTRIST